jgi:hypothetical protein
MRSRALPLVIVGAVLIVFLGVGAFLIFRSQSGGPPVTWNVTVTGGARMSPDHLTAKQGAMVTINVTSDREGEVHLHGYDLSFEAKPGETVSKTFKADSTGSFDIEWESTSTHLGDLVVSP